jgi:small subunit ribosomal protein S7
MISTLMIHGKKSIAEKIIYGALDEIESVTKQEPL